MTDKVALKIAYIGTCFHGYARQPTVPTVEGTIIEKLLEKQIIESVKKAQIRCASRTDKHVSAVTNIMTFYTDEYLKNVLYSLKDEFESIFPYGITKVSEDFNPRYALKRRYQYFLPKHKFSTESLKNALSLFVGEHNFSNFARIEIHRNPVKTIDVITVVENQEFIQIEITAQLFLWNQIRRIIEVAIKYCKGKISLSEIQNALDNTEKTVDFNIAPATPLILKTIEYPNLTFFEPDQLKQCKSQVVYSVKQEITNLVF